MAYYNDYGYDSYGSYGGGYTSTFGGNFLVDHIPFGSNYIYVSNDLGYAPGYGEIYYRRYGSKGYDSAQYYYNVTKYSSDGNYYLHSTGYLNEPGPSITESYSSFLYVNGYTSYSSRNDYSHSENDIFIETRDNLYHNYNANGLTYEAELNLYITSDSNFNYSKYTSFNSMYTNPQGYSYYYSGHS